MKSIAETHDNSPKEVVYTVEQQKKAADKKKKQKANQKEHQH